MTQKEINAGNKLIAEFMGGKVIDNIFICNESTKTHNERYLHHYNIAQARYNTSWDWLMPVVEKIEKLSARAFDYRYFDSDYNRESYEVKGYYFTHSYSPLNKTFKVDSNSKLHACWIICVEFIKWFNEQQKENM